MPAKFVKRVHKTDGFFHIFNSGVSGQAIFNDQQDYQTFINFLEEYLSPPKSKESYKKEFTINGKSYKGVPHRTSNYSNDIDLLAYSLTPTKFEILLEQKNNGALEKFMRSLSTRYSMYFNKKYNRKGSLFEGPYKSIHIEKDKEKVLDLTRRLHQEGLSSFCCYTGEEMFPWVKTNTVLSFFESLNTGSNNYVDYVKSYQSDSSKTYETIHLTRSNPVEESEALDGSNPDLEGSETGSNDKRSANFNFLQVVSSVAMFLLLFSFGIKNVHTYEEDSTKALSLRLFQGGKTGSSSLAIASPKPTYKAIEIGTKTNNIDNSISSPKPTLVPQVAGVSTNSTNHTIKIKENLENQNINIRINPSTDSKVIAVAHPGDTFESVLIEGEWYKIVLPDGYGFIHSSLVDVNTEGVNQ